MSIDPAEIVTSIPGWESATISPLEGGLTNDTWLLSDWGRRGVLKIDPQSRIQPFLPRPIEAVIQNRAAAAGLANAVLHASDTVILSEYVPGNVWTRDSFDSDMNLKRLANALRRLHALPPTGYPFDAQAAAHAYVHQVDPGDVKQANACLAIIEAAPQAEQLCCCHNDLVAANLVDVPQLRLLDWEYAGDNTPLFDLATVVAHHDLADAQRDLLLDTYFQGDGARWLGPLEQQIEMYRALTWLWQAASSPGVS